MVIPDDDASVLFPTRGRPPFGAGCQFEVGEKAHHKPVIAILPGMFCEYCGRTDKWLKGVLHVLVSPSLVCVK